MDLVSLESSSSVIGTHEHNNLNLCASYGCPGHTIFNGTQSMSGEFSSLLVIECAKEIISSLLVSWISNTFDMKSLAFNSPCTFLMCVC